ncbi:MAG: glycoside hydrolase family 3 C-terminal domain-containing protein [Bacteroidales bacterium]|nr:glycoside hydrolase family 3 C-terminal domain-containing protein [Bacteroidales bacterium]
MKKLLFSLFLGCAALSVQAQGSYTYPFQNPNLSDDERIDNLISLMNFEEKIGMYGGGGVPRLGVRSPGSSEAIHGVVQGGPAWNEQRSPKQPTTIFPQGYGLGETWDPALLRQVADQVATEARYLYQSPKYRRSGLVLWSPNADLGRDIRWGRTEECYGEDPYLVGEMTTAFVKGLQGNHPKYWKTASLMKHFLANSNEYGRTETSSDFDDVLFREYYSYGFWRGIKKGGANALMTAYNEYNGIPCTIHPILRTILMKEWGFNGMITTDGGAFQQLKTSHKVFSDLEYAAQACVKAGTSRFLDSYMEALEGAFNKGLISYAELEGNIKGNIRIMIKLGLLDSTAGNPYSKIGISDTIDPWTKQETKDFARLVANKSAVLLKNEKGMLPLNKQKITKIAVIGNRADDVIEDWYSGTLPYKITPLQGIREVAEANKIEVRYVKDDRRGEAQKTASWADVVIVCVGNHPTCSPEWAKSPWGQGVIAGEGREDVDRGSIQLEQEDLIKLVYKANPRTVVVLISSFPYAINWTQQHVPAILHLTQGCQELGHAVADLLFGAYNPAGRTTQTWVSSIDELPPMLDYNIRNGRTYMYFKGKPLYPFGYGLSYTSFAYSDLRIDKNTLTSGETLKVSVNIENTGSCDGEEVVQLYVKPANDKASKQLKGFMRVPLKKGEKKRVIIPLPAEDLCVWNIDQSAWQLPAGSMKLMIGSSSESIKLDTKVELKQ